MPGQPATGSPQVVVVPQDPNAQKQQLLDTAELNAGASAVIPVNPVSQMPGNPVRLLDLQADSSQGRIVTITFSQQFQSASGLIGNNPQTPSLVCPTGPVRGIIEFGNGATFSTVEVDIPPPDQFGPAFENTISPVSYKNSGVSLSVPAGSIRVYARNDGNAQFLTPTPPFVIGTGTVAFGTNAPLQDPIVLAHASYNSTYGSVPPTRTEYIFRGGSVLAPTDEISIDIPPFATGVRFYANATNDLTAVSPGFRIGLFSVATPFTASLPQYMFAYDVAPGSDGHVEFSGDISYITIRNTSVANIISMAAVFDIGNF
jgi:hypothetical protein